MLDTSSDLHLIRAEEYIKLGVPSLTGSVISCKGFGNKNMSTLGSFAIDVTIDDNDFRLTIHAISDTCMNHSLLLGLDLLKDANIELTENNTVIMKRADKITDLPEKSDVPEVFCINIEEIVDDCRVDNRQQIKLHDIEDPTIEHEIKDMINNYKPQKLKESSVKMQLVLKDEIPVYQRPRRLAPAEKVQVKNQIENWLRDGIIRPSISEYASPITLAKKENGNMRLCVDYTKLNKKIIKDRYPLLLIDD